MSPLIDALGLGLCSLIVYLMKSDIFVWNCQGWGNLKFHRFLKEHLRDFYPDVVMLVETRISGLRVDKVIKCIGMSYFHRVKAKGFSCGIWVLWKDTVDVEVFHNDFQFVHL